VFSLGSESEGGPLPFGDVRWLLYPNTDGLLLHQMDEGDSNEAATAGAHADDAHRVERAQSRSLTQPEAQKLADDFTRLDEDAARFARALSRLIDPLRLRVLSALDDTEPLSSEEIALALGAARADVAACVASLRAAHLALATQEAYGQALYRSAEAARHIRELAGHPTLRIAAHS
jgi:biotin operon repressor